MLPCADLAKAKARLDASRLEFLPTATLAPGLAELLALRGRIGFASLTRMLAKSLALFEGDALHLVATDAAPNVSLLREFLAIKGWRGLLLEGTEGEAFANPRRSAMRRRCRKPLMRAPPRTGYVERWQE